MPGTTNCISCKTQPAQPGIYYMFLRKGGFSNKTYVDQEIWKHCCHDHPEIFKQVEVTAARQFRVCTGCCEVLLGMDQKIEVFLGFLKKAQYEKYSTYSKQSITLNNDGFVIVPCEFSIPRRLLFKYLNSNKPSTLTNGSSFSGSGRDKKKRMWSQFKTDPRNCTTIKEHMKDEGVRASMTSVIAPDIIYGAEALKNDTIRDDDDNLETKLRDNTVNISGECALLREIGLNEYQGPHTDTVHGSYNAVVPFTQEYTLQVWEGSHHLPQWTKQNEQPLICSCGGKTLTANVGQIIIFHSNLIHCGGASCNIIARSLVKSPSNVSKKLLKDIFKTGEFRVTDVSVHFTIDSIDPSVGQYDCGIVEIFTPKVDKCAQTENISKGGECYYKTYLEKMRKARRNFENMRRKCQSADYDGDGVPCYAVMSKFENVLDPPRRRKSSRLSKQTTAK